MLKKSFVIILLISSFAKSSYAQEFIGYNSNNYQTIAGANFNPANIANSRYKLDINLFSISAYGANNGISVKKNIGSSFEEGTDFFMINDGKTKHMNANIDVLGPGFMINLGSKWGAIGVSSRLRTIASGDNLNNDIFQLFGNGSLVDYYGKRYTQNNLNINVHSFADLGITYARTLWANKNHLLSGGLTAKYIKGVGATSLKLDKAEVMIDLANISTLPPSSIPSNADLDALTDLKGEMTFLYNDAMDILINDQDISEAFKKAKNNNGWGIDLGLAYEWYPDKGRVLPEDDESIWRNNRLTPYKIRASMAITDIGSVKYKLGNNARKFTLKSPSSLVLLDDLNIDANSFDEYINYFTDSLQLLQAGATPANYKVSLPTTLRMNVDWRAYQSIYVNAGANINLLGSGSYGARYGNYYYITPRYERKWFSVSSPLSINSHGQFAWGLGIQAGPFFVGSGSVMNYLTKSELKAVDAYFGIHIPIFQKVKKTPPKVVAPPIIETDSDGDGIIDRLDKCPYEAGVEKYDGCPIPDTDKDGVNDDEDKCPEIPGLALYGGCPIPDTDGDGLNDQDDFCPEVFGFARYLGCPIPDTDGDGINDEEDKCIDEFGVIENHGCPVITKEVEAKVNMAAKQILFATGSDRLLSKSFPALDEVMMLMYAHKSIKMNIEGHTDATGNANKNQELSTKRAKAVKTYLESKGIAPERLLSKGYGQTKPIADNKTSAGRTKNRRVEIKLHY